jgi:hypothetical protein
MLRNTILALAAAVALGTIFLATEASARGGHGGFGRLQNDSDVATAPITNARFDDWRFRSYTGDGCWTWGHVQSPRGWVWRRVNVCY